MMAYRIDLVKMVRFFSIVLAASISALVNGQQGAEATGVSLKVQGLTTPNNSIVDVDDILRFAGSGAPTNVDQTLHESSLLCVTDLIDCCESPRTVRGDWYFPSGTRVGFGARSASFQSNRGSNEFIDATGRQVNGSVRLFRIWTPTARGRFRCEIPSAANPSVNQTLYASILDFDPYIKPVVISPFGVNDAGETYSLMCSTILVTTPLPDDVPSPTFEWFFGPNGHSSLPSGVTPMETTLNIGPNHNYSSTLVFSQLSQAHAGKYTCRLGANRLKTDEIVFVNDPPITVNVAANLNYPLTVGQHGSTLMCAVIGADNLDPVITYQWSRNAQETFGIRAMSKSRILSLSPLRLSHAGNYSCSVNVSSTLLNNKISVFAGTNTQSVIIQIPDPQSVIVSSSSLGDTVLNGAAITVTCSVDFASTVMGIELPLLTVDAELSRDGVPLPLTGPTVTGTTLVYSTRLSSFGRKDSGNYTCQVTVGASSNNYSPYLDGISHLSHTARLTTGVFLSLRNETFRNNNSNVMITDIREGDCGALLCFTDLNQCCSDNDSLIGQWLYPNGSAVGEVSDEEDYYIDRGSSVVRLNRKSRLSNVPSITGKFCCEVPDATATNTRICITLQQEQISTASCANDVGRGMAIAVAATILIEILLAVPIATAVVRAFCWKRKEKPSNDAIAVKESEIQEARTYEDLDESVAANAPARTYTSIQPASLQPKPEEHVYEVITCHHRDQQPAKAENGEVYEIMNNY